MRDLLAERNSVAIIKFFDLFEQCWRLCHKSSLDKERLDLLQLVLLGKKRHVREEFSLWYIGERVTDPALYQYAVLGLDRKTTYSPSMLAISLLILSLRLCSSLYKELWRSWCPAVTCLKAVSMRSRWLAEVPV